VLSRVCLRVANYFAAALNLLHCLLIRKASRVDCINAVHIEILDSVGSLYVLSVFFLSAIICEDVLIHKKVGSAELVDRVVFKSA